MNAPVAPPPYLSPAPSQSKVLRKLYLMLFLRGRSSRGLQKGAPKSVARKLMLALLIYGLYGAIAIAFIPQTVLALSAYLHGMSFLFLGMFVASSAGEILFNKDEADILLHRPVNPRAMLWAKISVLVQVSLWLALALNLVGLGVGVVVRDGGWLYPVIHVVSTVVEALFCTGFIVLIYQLCLRWLGRERLDGLMTTAQVGLAIFVIVGAQIFPRLLGNMTPAAAGNLKSAWLALLPPMWFAGFDNAIVAHGGGFAWALAGWSVVATGIVLALAFGKLAHSYEAGLQKLGENISTKPQRLRRRWVTALLNVPPFNWWLGNPVSRASFLLVTAYMSRDRDVKLRLYPGIAPILMMPIIFLWQGQARGGGGFGLALAGGYLGLVPFLAQNILQYSQHWAAADLFHVVPLTGPGAICHGARKAVLLFLTLPLLALLAIVLFVWKQDYAQLMLMIPGVLTIPLFALLPGLLGKTVPLSKPPEDARAANRGVSMIGMLFVSMALSGLALWSQHAGWFWWLVLGEVVVLAGLYAFFRRRLDRTRWESLE